MINSLQTDDLELKKLVYLYCQNYAKTQPDLAIMAVNTFVKDSQVSAYGRCGQAAREGVARACLWTDKALICGASWLIKSNITMMPSYLPRFWKTPPT